MTRLPTAFFGIVPHGAPCCARVIPAADSRVSVNLRLARSKGALLLSFAVILFCAMTAAGQSATNKCRPASVIPVANEPPAKIVVDPPLAEPLASRGVVVIQYCAENLRLMPVFGPNALAVSPRVGHIHVSVDDASWVWADASGNPIILMGLSPGPHKVLIELMDANHQPLDKGTVKFVVPEKPADQKSPPLRLDQVSNH